MYIKATVSSNCQDDPYLRVKVKHPLYWAEESSLLSSVNSIYLDKGDVVIVDYSDDGSSIIVGKLLTDEQKDKNPVKGKPVLFQATKDSKWVVATLDSEEFKVTTSEGVTVVLSGDKVSIANKTLNLHDILHDLLNSLNTTTPTTQGSPAAQNFNPAILTSLNEAITKIDALLK